MTPTVQVRKSADWSYCPCCGGSLDTGYECSSCGRDWREFHETRQSRIEKHAAALQATEQRVWEEAAQIAEEFGALSWEEMEARYTDLGITVAKLLRQRAQSARQGEEGT